MNAKYFVCKKYRMQELFTKWLLLCLEVYFEKIKCVELEI